MRRGRGQPTAGEVIHPGSPGTNEEGHPASQGRGAPRRACPVVGMGPAAEAGPPLGRGGTTHVTCYGQHVHTPGLDAGGLRPSLSWRE